MRRVSIAFRPTAALLALGSSLGGLPASATGLPRVGPAETADAKLTTKKTPAITRLPTDVHVACVRPQTSAQAVSLPRTGGVTVLISFGAFPGDASGCDYVRVGTGANVEPTRPPVAPSLAASGGRLPTGVRIVTPTAAKGPILTVTVGEGLDAKSLFGTAAIVTGMKLKASPNLFPDGTYYATITTTSALTSSLAPVIAFKAKGGVLTIAPLETPDGKAFPLLIKADTSSIIALYPRGVEPPPAYENLDQLPTSTPPANSIPPPPSTLVPEPAHGSPGRGTYGNPPPDLGTQVGIVSWDWTEGCSRNPGCAMSDRPVQQQSIGATVQIPGGLVGRVTFVLNIGYMGITSYTTKNCPKDWALDISVRGSGTILIPGSSPAGASSGSAYCTITFSTLPPGRHGDSYTEDVVVTYISIGDH